MMRPLEALKKYWGYDSFRSLQQDIIDDVLDGKDTIALLHTGAGKSLCFQLPALLFPGKTLVISPLIALMQDQVAALQAKGINAKAIYSGIGYRQVDLILDNFANGPLKILYVSPERLKTDIFLARFKKTDISLIAVDEAHCISQWGHDFRPSYYEIPALRAFKPDVPIIAVTATATPEVAEDIASRLELKTPIIYRSTFSRDNLSMSVMMTEGKMDALQRVLEKFKGSGIIYLRSRKKVKLLAEMLNQQNIKADFYHGGMTMKSRMKVQQSWIKNEKRLIVCTNAFGMGVDKSDVRFVIHMDIPPSIEEYYQEAGRAGRDDKFAYAVAIIGYSDIVRLEKHHLISYPSIKFIKNVYLKLCSFLKIGYGSGAGETFEINLEDFCNTFRFNIGAVYSVLNILEKESWLTLNEGFKNPSQLLITSDKNRISLSSRNKELKSKMLLYLLRKYEGIFIDFVKIDEGTMANDLNVKTDQIKRELMIMDKETIISYKPSSEQPRITYILDRPAANSFTIDESAYKNREQIARDKMNSILEYVSSFKCRQQTILTYFDEKSEPCGRCDICKGSKEKEYTDDEKEKLFQHLTRCLSDGILDREVYMDKWPFNKKNKAYACIQQLEFEKRIKIDDNNFIHLVKAQDGT